MKKRESELKKQIAGVKSDEEIMEEIMKEKEAQNRVAKSYVGVNPIVYSDSGSAYPGKPDVDMKFKGWIGMFGEHFLCELDCKKFADKSLDKVLRFMEKEIRHFYEGKQIKKKGKSSVEVKSYLRKSRKKKEIEPDDHEEHIEANIKMGEKLGLVEPKKSLMSYYKKKVHYEKMDGNIDNG